MTIPTKGVFREWREDPEYQKELEALAEEFVLADLFIKARAKAGLTQKQIAERMDTSQAYIARLEGGKEKPSTRTLEKFADATGHKLHISFEPVEAR